MSDPDIRITVTRSAGADKAVVVFIDTNFEPSGSDGSPGLRVSVNDGTIFNASGVTPGQQRVASGGVDYDGEGDSPSVDTPSRELYVQLDEI